MPDTASPDRLLEGQLGFHWPMREVVSRRVVKPPTSFPNGIQAAPPQGGRGRQYQSQKFYPMSLDMVTAYRVPGGGAWGRTVGGFENH